MEALPSVLRSAEKIVRAILAVDPNDKVGVDGAGPQRYIRGNEKFPYLIRFENKPDATASAQRVLIVDTLDTEQFDLETFELEYFRFHDRTFRAPPGLKSYGIDVPLEEENLVLRIEAELDSITGVFTCTFTSLNPETLMPTLNPLAGFLPPNKTAPEGEGEVFFTVRPKEGIETGSVISNKASIYFDQNEVIETPAWSNSVDALFPTSAVSPLSAEQTDSTFAVRWSGEDEGSGLFAYTIYVSTNSGRYQPWLVNTVDNAATFRGAVDSTYSFYSVAVDSSGLRELAPSQADASTTVRLTTGTVDPTEGTISLYPNPSAGRFNLEVPARYLEATVTVANLLGQRYAAFTLHQMKTSVDLSHLRSGMYILQIEPTSNTQGIALSIAID